jgi:hypothetical protein
VESEPGVVTELRTRVLCDVEPPHRVDAVYLFGETVDNELSVIDAGGSLWHSGHVHAVAICGMEAKSGYPGFTSWQSQLQERGVGTILGVNVPQQPAVHTLDEAKALIRHAKEEGWKTLYITAEPFHQVRAFVSVVTALAGDYARLRIYNHVGRVLNWNEDVVHSQGVLRGKRSRLIRTEASNTDRYQRKGDLVSYEEALAYLNRRDTP